MPGVLLICIWVGQGSSVLAVGVRGHCLDIFLSLSLSLSLSQTTETTSRYRLRERPVKPKQPSASFVLSGTSC